MVQTHRHAPVAHGALRIGFGYAVKCLFGFVVPKRVQQRHGAIELLLRRFGARRGKVDPSKFFAEFVLVWMRFLREARNAADQHCESCGNY